MKYLQARSGSALLVSVILMSVVMGSALLFYQMIFKDIALFRLWRSDAQLWYANQSMEAWALAEISGHLRGYEPEPKTYEFQHGVKGRFELKAMGELTPCLEGESWSYLESQASIHQPLYTETSQGEVQEIPDFIVEFFLMNEAGQPVRAQGPLLRWKILGLEKMSQETQAISEFVALDLASERFSSERPSVFGPGYEGEALPPNYTHAKFFQTQPNYTFFEAYSIQDFLTKHDSNTLVLTSTLGPEYANYKLAYRVKAKNGKVVCPQAEIITEATQGDRVLKGRKLFPYAESLPVFDFVLYHTEE